MRRSKLSPSSLYIRQANLVLATTEQCKPYESAERHDA